MGGCENTSNQTIQQEHKFSFSHTSGKYDGEQTEVKANLTLVKYSPIRSNKYLEWKQHEQQSETVNSRWQYLSLRSRWSVYDPY